MTAAERPVPLSLRLPLIALTLASGAVVSWRYRHFMYPDGVQYLDVAQRVEAIGVRGLLNGCWSPLYPLLLAGAGRVLHPSPYWLYPSVQMVGFVDFAIALAAFDYFVRRAQARRERTSPSAAAGGLSPAAFTIASYAAFIVVVAFLLNVRLTTPDMLVAAAVFATSGLLLSMESNGWTARGAIALGALLAAAYFDKTVMFPIGTIYAASAIALASGARARKTAAMAAVAFAVFASAWLVPLSIWKGRPTFGDTGVVMYAWWVNGWDTHLHWIGNPPGSGTPLHPVQQLAAHPDTFAFAPQAPVTYALFFDPTYWYDGIAPRFDLADQRRAFARTAREFADVLRQGFTALGPVLAIAVAASSLTMWRRLVAFRIVIVPALLAILLHLVVHVEGRLIAGALAVLVVTLLASVAYAPPRAAQLVAAACVAAAVMTTGRYVAGAAHGALQDLRAGETRIIDPTWSLAEALTSRGLHAGDRIAVIGNDYDVMWAQRASLSIVAEVSVDQMPAYLGADTPTRAHVVDAFRTLGVRAVIARSASPVFDAAPWTRIPATEFSLFAGAAP